MALIFFKILFNVLYTAASLYTMTLVKSLMLNDRVVCIYTAYRPLYVRSGSVHVRKRACMYKKMMERVLER